MKLRTQQCLQNVSGFRYKIPRNTSQNKLTNVLINDMFTNKKLQVKVPHTILTKSNIFINRIYSKQLKDSIDNKSKNIHSSIKRRGFIQTFKCIEVQSQQQQQKINNRMQKIYQEIERNDLNKGMDKQLKAFRRTIFSRRTSESKKQQRSQLLRRGSLSVDFSQQHNKIKEQSQNQYQQPVLKNWHEIISKKNQESNKPIKLAIKQKDVEYKRSRSSFARKQKSVYSSKHQTICGWNNDENSEFIC